MRFQYSIAILLMREDEFLSPRQMAETLNYTPVQIGLMRRVLANYNSRNHLKGYPSRDKASESERETFSFWTMYRADNGRDYPCYSGAIYKYHYGDKMQSLSASLILSALFLKQDDWYTPQDLLCQMLEKQLLGKYASPSDHEHIIEKISLFLDFLETPGAIYGYQLKALISTPRFWNWGYHLCMSPKRQSEFLHPIAMQFCSHIVFAKLQAQKRQRSLLLDNIPKIRPTSIHNKSAASPSRVPELVMPSKHKEAPNSLWYLVGVAALLFLTLLLLWPEPSSDVSSKNTSIAIAVPIEPPI